MVAISDFICFSNQKCLPLEFPISLSSKFNSTKQVEAAKRKHAIPSTLQTREQRGRADSNSAPTNKQKIVVTQFWVIAQYFEHSLRTAPEVERMRWMKLMTTDGTLHRHQSARCRFRFKHQSPQPQKLERGLEYDDDASSIRNRT